MKKFILFFLFALIVADLSAQSSKKTAGYLSVQYTKTRSDRTEANNPWGAGAGFQVFFNNESRLKLTAELTADAYLEDDKVLRLNPNGTDIPTVTGMTNLFVGPSFHPAKTIYFSFVVGPSFVSKEILLGLKPSLGFYFSKTQKWTGKIYYLNILHRDKSTGQDFRSVGFSIGVKLF